MNSLYWALISCSRGQKNRYLNQHCGVFLPFVRSFELPKSLKSVPYTQGFYVARYFYLAYNNAKAFTDVEKSSLPRKIFQNWKYLSKKGGNTATTVQSGVTAALKDPRKPTTYCLNTLTSIARIAGVNGEGVGIVWQETRGRRVWNSILYRQKKPVSSKRLSLISSIH